MTIQFSLLALLLIEVIEEKRASITGVTYMDDFDFEDRYKDINECNPYYWHPLHLPDNCIQMYETLVRSKMEIAAYPGTSYEFISSEEKYNDEYYEMPSMSEVSLMNKMPPTPYKKMLDLLKKDIKKDPSNPEIGFLPNLGPVAIYNQEISKKSANIIKTLATAYAKFAQVKYAEYLGYNSAPNPHLYIWDSHKNNATINNNKDKKKYNNENRLTRTQTKNGDLVTIIETLRPRKRRHALYLS